MSALKLHFTFLTFDEGTFLLHILFKVFIKSLDFFYIIIGLDSANFWAQRASLQNVLTFRLAKEVYFRKNFYSFKAKIVSQSVW